MVPIWSCSRHLRKATSCFSLLSTSQTSLGLPEFLPSVCSRHSIFRQSCNSVLLWRHKTWNSLSYHREVNVTANGNQTNNSRVWRQAAACLKTHTDRTHHRKHADPGWKTFNDENNHFYNILRKKENYQKYFTATFESKKWNHFYNEMIESNKRLTHFDYHFTNFCTSAMNCGTMTKDIDPREPELAKINGQFSKLISELKTDEILCVIKKYHKIVKHFNSESIYTAFKLMLCSASQELKKRVETMMPEEFFRVADILYVTGFHRDNIMMKAVIQRCMNDPDILAVPEHRILFFFYLGLERVSRRGVTVEMRDQDEMASQLENCDINEIGITALGLFRAEIQLKSENLGLFLVNKLEENLKSCHPITLSALLKFILHTADRRLSEKFPSMNDALTNTAFISKIATSVSRAMHKDMPWIMRVCRLYWSIRFCPDEVFQAVLGKVLENGTRHMRLKDIAELMLRFSNFVYNGEGTQDFYHLVKDELILRESSLEFENYTMCLATCLSGLTQMNVYPHQLIQLLYSEKRLTKFGDKKFYFSRLPYVISESVKLERPDYSGPLLPKAHSDRIPDQYWYRQELEHAHIKSQMRDPTLRAQFTSALEEALEVYFGDRQFFKTHMFLPHFFSYDIGFAVDERGMVIPITDWCSLEGHLKQTHCSRVVIVPLLERDSLYTYMDQEGNRSQRMVAKIIMKFRQLSLLGFNVVHIFHNEFNECHNQQDLLHKKLSSFLSKSAEKNVSSVRKTDNRTI